MKRLRTLQNQIARLEREYAPQGLPSDADSAYLEIEREDEADLVAHLFSQRFPAITPVAVPMWKFPDAPEGLTILNAKTAFNGDEPPRRWVSFFDSQRLLQQQFYFQMRRAFDQFQGT